MGFVFSEEQDRLDVALEQFHTLSPEQELQLRRKRDALVSYGTRLFKWFDGFIKPDLEPDVEKKAFLIQDEIVACYQAILKTFGLRAAVLFLCHFQLDLRSIETSRIAVEDFLIDKDGFLKLDDSGVGRMFFPACKSKGGYGGSHAKGTPINPHVVEIFNEYLRSVRYRQCPFERHQENAGYVFTGKNGIRKEYRRGHGLLLLNSNPRHVLTPNYGISYSTISQLFTEMRKVLDFLPPEKREVLSSHDGRHSISELIESARYLPDDLLEHLSEASDIMKRHGMKRYDEKTAYRKTQKGGFIITDHQLLEICWRTIFHPMDSEDLNKWKEHVGLNTSSTKKKQRTSSKSGNTSAISMSVQVDPSNVLKQQMEALQAANHRLEQLKATVADKKRRHSFGAGEYLKLLGEQTVLTNAITLLENALKTGEMGHEVSV